MARKTTKEMSKKELQDYLSKRYKSHNEQIKNTYDRISCTLPKGTKDEILSKGETVNGLINKLVAEWLENN